MRARLPLVDLVAIVVCTLAWGTTWYVITWQFGKVDPVISLVYRFALASAMLFVWCRMRGAPMGLSFAQHAATLGVGLFTFAIDYVLVYWAEERVTSAVVAVIFAAMAFLNLLTFRLAFKQRAPRSAWIAAAMGVVGVLLLSWSEIAHAQMNHRTIVGLVMALGAVVGASIGNAFAHRGEKAGAPIAAFTAWAMVYGALLLVLYAHVTHRVWAFDFRWSYALSLIYLAFAGSVVAFLLYYGLARRRGYATAAYVSALTPPLAMAMSALFEAKKWGAVAMSGVALVLLGQWLLLARR